MTETRSRRIRLGIVGVGAGSFFGPVHRIAARLDDRYDVLAGALSSDPDWSDGAWEPLATHRYVMLS